MDAEPTTTPVVPPHTDPIAVKVLHLRIAKYRERLAALHTYAKRHSKEFSTFEEQAFLASIERFLAEDAI